MKSFKLNQKVLWHTEDFDGTVDQMVVITEVHEDHCIATTEDGINLACFACNQLKKNILPEDFLNRVTNVFMYQMEKKCRHNLQWKCIKRLLKTLG